MPSILPQSFIVDLRIHAVRNPQLNVFLSLVSYDEAGDFYHLRFSTDAGPFLEADVIRLDGPASRVFKPVTIGSGTLSCTFVPGDEWDARTWNGTGDWVQVLTPDQASVESSLILSGPMAFHRLLIDESETPDPLSGAWPLDTAQSLIGGYNINLLLVNPESGTPDIEIDAGPRMGLGYQPPDIEDSVLRSINGIGPDGKGNINLSTEDCLRISTPVLGEAPLPHTQQIDSDCSPCCPCSSYRKMGAAITTRSRKIRQLCQQIAAIQQDAIAAYTIGMKYIDDHTDSTTDSATMISRDPVLDKKNLYFTVQNKASHQAYAYVAVTFVVGAPAALILRRPRGSRQMPVNTSFSQSVYSDTSGIPPMHGSGRGSEFFPGNISNEPGMVIRIGTPSTNDNASLPLKPGGTAVVRIILNSDMRYPGVQIKMRTVSRMGLTKNFGFRGHTLTCNVITAPPGDPVPLPSDNPFKSKDAADSTYVINVTSTG